VLNQIHDYICSQANVENYIDQGQRQTEIEQAQQSFWHFCKTVAPDFYLDDREHLKIICNILQALYEGRIVRFPPVKEWTIVDSTEGLPTGYQTCKKLMLNLPPQHGKSRTLINFAGWVFGKNPKEKIITCSYNDSTASDFSRYTRDGITVQKIDAADIVYSDIFPKTRIKRSNAGFEKWALEGQHFSYLGAGVGGSITSKGGTILIVDDPVKGAEEAFNENHLDKIWRWYTGTFMSRVSAKGGEPLEIVNMTRWAKKDICGRILDGPEADEWYVLKMEVYNEATDTMLCPDLLSKKRYNSLRNTMDPAIFRANYHQEPVDIQGRLYKDLKEWTDIPRDDNGYPLFEQIISYTDTADEGNNWLCSIVAGVYQGEAWILDVYYTQEAMEITEPATADFLARNDVNLAKIESNNGGRGFARNVERLIWERHQTKSVSVEWFHQSANKIARILTNSSFITNHVFFPPRWNYKYPEFYLAITTFQKEGKNKDDDAADALTGLAEMINEDKEFQHTAAPMIVTMPRK